MWNQPLQLGAEASDPSVTIITDALQFCRLAAQRIAPADQDAGSIVNFTRPRGYFDTDRDKLNFDGITPPPGIARGTGAGLAASKIKLPTGAQRSISSEFNGQKLVGRTWPAAQGRLSLLELHD